MIRKHFIIKGSVQGVGLRYRAVRKARQMGITGYVRNLPDGSVEMELQGDRAVIGEFLLELERGPFIRIEDILATQVPTEESSEFRVL